MIRIKKMLIFLIVLCVFMIGATVSYAQSNGYTMIVKNAVLYRYPSITTEVIYNIDGKQEIEIIRQYNDAWYKVHYKDKTGYVQAELVRNTMFVIEYDHVYAAPTKIRTLIELKNGSEV